MRRVLSVFLILLILGAGYVYLALFRPYQGFSSSGVYVDIPHGASERTIARLLSENGIVRSGVAFEALCRSQKGRTTRSRGILLRPSGDGVRSTRYDREWPGVRQGIRDPRGLHDV